MEFKDYYDILGVKTDADTKAVKTAYRRLARKFHPDVSKEADAESKFKDVSEAYEVLGDAAKRAEYDQLRKYGRKGQNFTPPPGWNGGSGGAEFNEGNFSDFFSSIFGDRFQQSGATGRRGGVHFGDEEELFARRGQDVAVDLPVFLEDMLKEEAKTIEFVMPVMGEDGRRVNQKKTLKVKIPKGTVDGERIRLKGQGAPGMGKAPPGDVYLTVKLVPHPLFEVSGHDLTLTVPITPWEAALGTTVQVPTLHGRISLSVAPAAQTGQRLRVKGKGLPGKLGNGDLYVLLKVVMPTQVDAASKKLWQELASKASFDPRSAFEK